MNPQPHVIAHVFATDPTAPVARLVHLSLAAIADEHGHAETTVHTIEHMTGLLPIAIEAVLGHNSTNHVLFPASVTLVDGVITADLLPPRALAAVQEGAA